MQLTFRLKNRKTRKILTEINILAFLLEPNPTEEFFWDSFESLMVYLHFLTRFLNTKSLHRVDDKRRLSEPAAVGLKIFGDFDRLGVVWGSVLASILTFSTQTLYLNAFMRLPFTTLKTKNIQNEKSIK